jgi:hypothetical protein
LKVSQASLSIMGRFLLLPLVKGGGNCCAPAPTEGHLLHSGGQARAGRERRGGPRS